MDNLVGDIKVLYWSNSLQLYTNQRQFRMKKQI